MQALFAQAKLFCIPSFAQANLLRIMSGDIPVSQQTAMPTDDGQSGSQPTGAKRKRLEDPGDRAAKYLKPGGSFRMGLRRLGFHPRNRGGLGVSPTHVHDVAWDNVSNSTSL